MQLQEALAEVQPCRGEQALRSPFLNGTNCNIDAGESPSGQGGVQRRLFAVTSQVSTGSRHSETHSWCAARALLRMILMLLVPFDAQLSSCRTTRDCRTPSSEPSADTLSRYAAAICPSTSFPTSAQGDNGLKSCVRMLWTAPFMSL